MKVLGIDFTSRPTRRKPIVCVHCELAGKVLRFQEIECWTSLDGFQDALDRPGTWIAGLDFPFGQARKFIDTIGWPLSWACYVAFASKLGRDGFRQALDRYRIGRHPGDKEHRRATDIVMGAISPQKLHGVPVGLMFFEGAPRLLKSQVTIPHLKTGDPARVAVEAYPGVLARDLVGRRGYKNDTKKKQTRDQHEARLDILGLLGERAPARYGFAIDAPFSLCDDPGGDRLDAFLCEVQAGWAWLRQDAGFGAPTDLDPLEGWIAHPCQPPKSAF